MKTERLLTHEIVVQDRARPLNEDAVARLVESVRTIGLQTPLSVRWGEVDGEPTAILVAGRHRLEACKRLDIDLVDCVIFDDARAARMWELSENLHRAELSPVERADHYSEWIILADKGPQFVAPGGAQPHDKGIKRAARELPVPGKTERAKEEFVRRAVKIAGLPEDVKEQAREEGWSQHRLLQAAAPPREIVEARTKPAPAIKNAFESEEDWRRALFTVWNRGAADWRERALEAMDQPVFERTGAGRG